MENLYFNNQQLKFYTKIDKGWIYLPYDKYFGN